MYDRPGRISYRYWQEGHRDWVGWIYVGTGKMGPFKAWSEKRLRRKLARVIRRERMEQELRSYTERSFGWAG